MAKFGIIFSAIFSQIYIKIIANPIITIWTLQLICICIAFNQVVFHPDAFMFTNSYDGLKNYFTFYQYVIQEVSPMGLWHYTQMNYPFGEYIFFTDNTPFLALLMRFIHQHLFDISHHLVAIHNYIFLALHLILPVFIYKLIKPSYRSQILFIIIMSIGITWVNPQVQKFIYGVFNLSISLFSVFVLFILKDIYRLHLGEKIIWPTALKIFALIFLSGLFHIYYVPILALPIGLFLLYFSILSLTQKSWSELAKYASLGLSAALAGILLLVLINSVDSYAALRRPGAQGFGYDLWQFAPEAIITPYVFNSIVPLLKSCITTIVSSESQGFLGNFMIYNLLIGLTILVGYILGKRNGLRSFGRAIRNSKFIIGLIVTMLIVYATASGPFVKFCFIPLSFDNWFSVFYFFYKKIDIITQFRCLARFSWPGFWILFYLSILLYFKYYKIISTKNIAYANVVSVILCMIMIKDVADFIKYQNAFRLSNVFQENEIETKFKDLKNLDFSKYQAIYTLPAVIVGSENYDITLNDQPAWTEYWMRLSIYSGLPLFNCKMSRTAENQAQAQIDVLLKQKVSDLILNKVNDKKVLVIYWPDGERNYDVAVQPLARPAAFEGSKIIKQFKMDSLTSLEGIIYYEWDIKNNN